MMLEVLASACPELELVRPGVQISCGPDKLINGLHCKPVTCLMRMLDNPRPISLCNRLRCVEPLFIRNDDLSLSSPSACEIAT